MNEFVKYLGVIVLLIGVAILAIPTFIGISSNAILLTGLGVILVGYLGHIFLNKKAE